MVELSKHREKRRRQFCINFLERVSRKVFKMLRDDRVDSASFVVTFVRWRKKIAPYDDVILHSDYHRKLRMFVNDLDKQVRGTFDIEKVRGPGMTHLNRLQKLKNASEYKRERYNKIDG